MEKLKIPYPVVVEGKYDKLALQEVMEGRIITTDGFGIFKNDEKRALLRALAVKVPLIVLTDPDGAGGVIRSALSGMIPPDRIVRIYAPRIRGVEKRKKSPSAEGLLGVEGIDPAALRQLLEPYASPSFRPGGDIKAWMLMEAGLTGSAGSREARDRFGAKFGLPPGMNAGAFAAALGYLMTAEEFADAVRQFQTED
ncbi:MAG: DUF4093 domain-containing protein [Clostridia bacterium]|nr:DUF4093 domain-containing protein [Clostridia bacterium]